MEWLTEPLEHPAQPPLPPFLIELGAQGSHGASQLLPTCAVRRDERCTSQRLQNVMSQKKKKVDSTT